MTKRWTRVWQNALLVIGSLLIAISMTEGGLRFSKKFEPEPRCDVGERQDYPSRNFTVDAFTGWKMTPGTRFSWITPEYKSSYSANSQGFRSPSDFLPDEQRRKIVVLGDSFTFGTGVEYNETFGNQLELGLPGSVVYNLAMPGFGIDQMWLSIRHQALPLQPALVIVGLCDADFSRSQTAYRSRERRNKPAFKLLVESSYRKLRPIVSIPSFTAWSVLHTCGRPAGCLHAGSGIMYLSVNGGISMRRFSMLSGLMET
jgi:hypothetical protein